MKHEREIILKYSLFFLGIFFTFSLKAEKYEDPYFSIVSTNVAALAGKDVLSTNEHILVRKGEYIRVLSPSEEMFDFAQPYEGPAHKIIPISKQNLNKQFYVRLWRLFYKQGEGSSVSGATRSIKPGGIVPRYNQKLVVVKGGGLKNVCLGQRQTLAIKQRYNPNNEKTLSYRIKGKRVEQILWANPEVPLSLPVGIFNKRPGKVSLFLGEKGEQTELRLSYMNPLTPGGQLKWYVEQGCSDQLSRAMNFYRTYSK